MIGSIDSQPLENYQFQYRGLIMGIDTPYEIDEINGLDGLNYRVGDRDFPRSHGQVPGKLLGNYRLITIRMFVGSRGNTTAQTAEQFKNITTILSPDQGARDGTIPDDDYDKFFWKEPGLDRLFIRARPVRQRVPRRHDTEFGLREITFQLRAADPRKYNVVQRSLLDQIRSPGSTIATGSFNLHNGGSSKAYPIIRYTTGANNAGYVRNNTTDLNIEFDNLLINSEYQFDMDAVVRGARREAFTYIGPLNDVPDSEAYPYYKWEVPREPFYLVPGDNQCRISFNDTASFWWRDTDL